MREIMSTELDKRIADTIESFLRMDRDKDIRAAWRLTAAYCRRHGIETLRADHESRPNDKWRPTTSRDIANRHVANFRIAPAKETP